MSNSVILISSALCSNLSSDVVTVGIPFSVDTYPIVSADEAELKYYNGLIKTVYYFLETWLSWILSNRKYYF